jgi:drug/metabolite transporter (DMT)-like permease
MQKSVKAALYMIVCSALVAATTLLAKALGRGVFDSSTLHPLQISAGRFLFAWLLLVPVVVWRRPRFRGIAWRIHLGRSISGWAGVTCLFAAAGLMPLADATAISFLSPVVTMLLAIPLLGERIGHWRWTAAATALVGGWILIRPGADAFQFAAVVALLAALFMGLEAVLIKRLTGMDQPISILFINNSIGAAIALTAASFVWVAPSTLQWLVLAVIGIAMVSAQGLFIMAMRCADASFVIPFFYATLVFAAAYDLAVFEIIPGAHSLLGGALIISSALVLAWRESRQRTSA